jgi:hypothetical protein
MIKVPVLETAVRIIVIGVGLVMVSACGGAAGSSSNFVPKPPTGIPGPPTATATPTAEPSATPRPDLAADLMAYYPFGGNANDLSGNGNHGIVHGASLIADRFGQPDSAYHFDGQDDYIEMADSSPLDLTFEATLSAWLFYEPQPTQEFYTILEKSDPERDGHSRYGMWLKNDLAEFCVQPADLTLPQRCLDSELTLEPQQWHHLVGVSDGETLRIYVDGTLAGERSFSSSAISQNSFELFVGTDLYSGQVVYTLGAIDDIRIYKRALAEEEIRLLFVAEN